MNMKDHEHDLTLSLRIGSPDTTTTQSFPSLFPPVTPPQTLFPPVTPLQTNISLVELQLFYPNLLVSSSSSSSNHNNNNPSSFSSSSSNYNNTNPNLLVSPSNTNYVAVNNVDHANAPTPAVAARRSRRTSSQRRSQGKSETVPAPFPWATNRRATVHRCDYLLQNNITTITGRVHCRRCEQEFEMSLDLEKKVDELRRFIHSERGSMHDRAPGAWVNPVLAKCEHCGRENSAKPILVDVKKREINWLFLLLGQMVGCCTLEHLKYFCKHTSNHRTGAKDRLLYLAYMTLCKQLLPECFD